MCVCVGGIIGMLSKTILELSYMASYRDHISYQKNKQNRMGLYVPFLMTLIHT